MEFEKKYQLIKQAVKPYADRYGVFTEEDLVNEAWLNKQVREAEKESHVIKAAKDACGWFLRSWHKTGIDRKKQEINIIPLSVLAKDGSADMCEYEQDNTTELLKEDLYKLMSKTERRIVEYRLQGRTYKEIAEKLKRPESTVRWIHKNMQRRMSQQRNELLGM
uniref:Putative sigma-70 region domain containing protein n=1 Tax=viral metagenome TaxID=1070528 RepID=A0A6M3IZY4_9ZZZZ